MVNSPQELITSKNRLFSLLLRYQVLFFFLLTIFLFTILFAANWTADKPLLSGAESYFMLTSSSHFDLNHFSYFPFTILMHIIPENYLIFLTLILALANIFFIHLLAKRWALPDNYTFCFLLLLSLSPSFIYTLGTLSLSSYFLFLLFSGLILLSSPYNDLRLSSIIPLALAASLDFFSASIVIILLFFFLYSRKELFSWTSKLHSFILILVLLLNRYLHKPFFSGPFYQNYLTNLFSDFGSPFGLSIFLIVLSLIGLPLLWKKKDFVMAYFLLFFLLLCYLFNTSTTIFLSLVIIFIATKGFINLFERRWILSALKRFTFYLLLLGIIFSTIAYLNRSALTSPDAMDLDALTWIKENTPAESIVLSAPENAYYLEYFAQRQPLLYLDHPSSTSSSTPADLALQIFNSSYITELFPLLEQNNVTVLYLTPQMRSSLSLDQGFIFLLKNERFKMAHSRGDIEVWLFLKE